MEAFLTPEQAAKILQVSKNTIYIKCRNGEIQHKKIGSRVCIYSNQFLSKNPTSNIQDAIFGQNTNPLAVSELKSALEVIADGANKALEAIRRLG